MTAVAVNGGYECHACGRTFRAGMVRVPRAWGNGGERMAEAAGLPLPYPEAAVVAEGTLAAQSLALARDLPERPLVLGGCCCSHVGAVEGLAARHGRIAVVWVDAHGDLNTPETSVSGNTWGMPLRMLIDSGAVRVEDVALVGARNLDPPEVAFIEERRLAQDDGIDAAIAGAGGVYVALDCDGLDESELASFMPEPDGLTVAETEAVLHRVAERSKVLGAGITGGLLDDASVDPLVRLLTVLRF